LEGVQPILWESRSQYVTEFLKNLKPDIYGVQELCETYHETIMQAFGDNY